MSSASLISAKRPTVGLLEGAITSICYGLFFVFIAQADSGNILSPVLMVTLVMVAVLEVLMAVQRPPVVGLRDVAVLVLAAGVLKDSGSLALLLARHLLQPAVTGHGCRGPVTHSHQSPCLVAPT